MVYIIFSDSRFVNTRSKPSGVARVWAAGGGVEFGPPSP